MRTSCWQWVRLVIGLVMGLLGAGGLRHAWAYSCGLDEITAKEFTLDLAGERGVALNSQVRVFWGYEDAGQPERISVQKKGGAVVPGTSRLLAKEGERGMVFVPTQPLEAATRYEVTMIGVAQPSDASTEKTKGRIEIGWFETGKDLDGVAPQGPAVIEGALTWTDLRTDSKNQQYPTLQLAVGDVSDERTPLAKLVFAVWSSVSDRPNAPIDYSRPPEAIYHATVDDYGGHRVLMFTKPTSCDSTGFGLPGPIPTSMKRPAGSAHRPLRLGVRAMDLAGNQGSPAELTVDLAQPVYVDRAWDSRGNCDALQLQEQVHVLPGRGSTVPLNSHVWIWTGSPHMGLFGEPNAKGPIYRVLNAQGDVVKTTTRTFHAGSTRVLELIPTAAWQPRTQYRVTTEDRDLDALTTFTTGDAADTTAPIGQVGPLQAGKGASVSFATEGVTDGEAVNPQPVLFAVYLPTQGRTIMPGAAPRTYVVAKKGRITLTEGGWCDKWNLSFPIERAEVSIMVRAVDLAGNLGPATTGLFPLRALRRRAQQPFSGTW